MLPTCPHPRTGHASLCCMPFQASVDHRLEELTTRALTTGSPRHDGGVGGSYIRLYFHKSFFITLKRIFINICSYLPTSNGLSREFSYVFTHIPFLHTGLLTLISSVLSHTFARLLEQTFRTVNSYLSHLPSRRPVSSIFTRLLQRAVGAPLFLYFNIKQSV